MAELTLIYSQLEDVSKYAEKVSSDCDAYKIELRNKLTNKWASVPKSPLSAGNSRIHNASYYVKQKSKKLEEKRRVYKIFANEVDDLIEVAKTADKTVAKSVNGSREAFLKEHKNLKGDGWAAFFANLVVNVPVLGWIAEKIDGAIQTAKDIVTNIRYWYEVCGGKEKIETALAIAGVVLAVIGLVVAACGVLAITAFGWAAIVAVAALIAAVIGTANAFVNLHYQRKGNSESDPAWAAYYGGFDTVADHLRKITFESDWWNKWSGAIATGIEITEIVCSVVVIFDGIGKLFTRSGIGKLFETRGEFDFSKFKQTLTSKEGWCNIGKALKQNWKGMLFGDSGGVEGWKKRWKRAFTSKNTNTAKRISKIGKVVKNDLGKINNLTKSINTILSAISDGFSYKTIYDPIKNIYSSSGNSGSISTDINTIDAIASAVKKVSDWRR